MGREEWTVESETTVEGNSFNTHFSCIRENGLYIKNIVISIFYRCLYVFYNTNQYIII